MLPTASSSSNKEDKVDSAFVFQCLQTWLDKAAASDYLPEKTGYAFAQANNRFFFPSSYSSSSSSFNSQEDELLKQNQFGMPRLHELAVRYTEMRKEFEHSAILQRKKRTYLDLFHPFQTTVIHGKWFRLISIAEIAAIESLFWKKTHESLSLPSTQQSAPITIVLADGEFDAQSSRCIEQLHAFFDLPGPPALPTLHDEITRSFFFVPFSQFTTQLLAPSIHQLKGSIILSGCEYSSIQEFRTLHERIDWLCSQQGTGFPARIIVRIPSYGGPATANWLFQEDHLPSLLKPEGLQRSFSLALSSKEEHERLVLARNGIPDLFARGFVIGSIRDDLYLHLFLRSCEIEQEWNHEPNQQCFAKLAQTCAVPTTNASPTTKVVFRGLLSSAPWSELDEYRLSSSSETLIVSERKNEVVFQEFVESYKYDLSEDSKMFVFTSSPEHAQILYSSLSENPAKLHLISFLSLEDPLVCSRIHKEVPDWLERISYVVVWLPPDGFGNPMGVSNEMLDRFLFYLSLIRSKELSGFTLHTNNQAFLDSFLSEKERRDQYLHSHMYIERRIRAFPSLCLDGTSDAELISYIHV